MKKAIVTGAGGFVGAALVHRLLDRGVEVYAVVRRGRSTGGRLNPTDGLHLIECNMDEYESLPDRIGQSEIDAFFHFAWEGSAGPGRADYALQLANIRYSVDAVAAASRCNAKRFIGAGSIMEKEADFFIPQDGVLPGLGYIYSTAKLTAHYMAKTKAASLGIPFVWGVISNAFGEGETSPRFINTTLLKLLQGNEVDFTEGRQFYDFLHVSDMAEAFFRIAESGKPFSAYYLGSGHPASLRDYIERMAEIANPEAVLGFGRVPFNGVYLPVETFDATPLFTDTGFRPSLTFEDAIRRTVSWLKEREGIL